MAFPSSLVQIGDSAFISCPLTAVELPEGLTTVSYQAFMNCKQLASVSLPSTLTALRQYAFENCQALERVVVPGSVAVVSRQAFNNCAALASVTLEPGVETIESHAFANASSLTEVVLPDTVTSIDPYAFSECNSLTTVTCSVGSQAARLMAARGFAIHDPDWPIYAFSEDGNGGICLDSVSDKTLTAYTVPEGVTEIALGAFRGCAAMTEITLPQSLKTIGESAFRDCARLARAPLPASLEVIDTTAFSGCASLADIALPQGLTTIGSQAFYGCAKLTSVTIPQGVISIGNSAFGNCVGLTELAIPDSVTSVGEGAFHNCGMAKLTIPRAVTAIGERAFADCDALTDVELLGDAVELHARGFEGCSSLKRLIVTGDTLDTLGGITDQATVYCHRYSDADSLAKQAGNPVAYLDDADPEALRTFTLPEALRLECGSTADYADCFFPTYDDPQVSWRSSDAFVARVENGVVTAVAPGTATVTVTVGGASASMEVTCFAIATAFEIPEELWVFAQETTPIPVSDIQPEGADLILTWQSADAKLATVDQEGGVYGRKPGNDVTVTATSDHGVERACTVHVMRARDDMKFLDLPADLETVEAETFEGGAFEAVLIPDGCTAIGSRAFADCKNLVYVRIPASVTTVADDAFSGSDQAHLEWAE